MLVATLYLGVLSSSPQEPILEQTGRGADVQMCRCAIIWHMVTYGIWSVGCEVLVHVWSATGAVHSWWGVVM